MSCDMMHKGKKDGKSKGITVTRETISLLPMDKKSARKGAIKRLLKKGGR